MENIENKKVCSCCEIEKDINDFEKSIIKGRTYIRNKCKRCRQDEREYKYDKETIIKLQKQAEKRKYGITRDEIKYDKCIICHTKYNLCIDHCHTSTNFRGLLCKKCNTAIAYFKEDIEIMQSAIEYIKHFENGGSGFIEFKDLKKEW